MLGSVGFNWQLGSLATSGGRAGSTESGGGAQGGW